MSDDATLEVKSVAIREGFQNSPRRKNTAVSFSAEYGKGQRIEKQTENQEQKEEETDYIPLRVRKKRRANPVPERNTPSQRIESENILEIKERSLFKSRRSRSVEPAQIEILKVV